MGVYIRLLPNGVFRNGTVNGPAHHFDGTNKLIMKGRFDRSRLNDGNGIVIDYDHDDYKLFQLSGNFVNNVATGSMRRILYNGIYTLDNILEQSLTVPATLENCTYNNGSLITIDEVYAININITYVRHPTQSDNFMRFDVNSILV